MNYHPGVFVLGRRDVIAAWVVLVVVAAGALLAEPGASAGNAMAVTNSQIAPPAPIPAPRLLPHDALCADTQVRPVSHRG